MRDEIFQCGNPSDVTIDTGPPRSRSFRAGFIGRSDADPLLGVAVMTGVNAVLFLITYRMFATGYRLKS